MKKFHQNVDRRHEKLVKFSTLNNPINLFNNNSSECSKITTKNYNTSFTLGIQTLNEKCLNKFKLNSYSH